MPKPLTRELVARATVTDGAARCWMFSKDDEPFIEEKIVLT